MLSLPCPPQYSCNVMDVQVLVNHYERCGRYYGSGGWGSHGSATEEEKRLTMMLFSGIFDSLAQRVSKPAASVQNVSIELIFAQNTIGVRNGGRPLAQYTCKNCLFVCSYDCVQYCNTLPLPSLQ